MSLKNTTRAHRFSWHLIPRHTKYNIVRVWHHTLPLPPFPLGQSTHSIPPLLLPLPSLCRLRRPPTIYKVQLLPHESTTNHPHLPVGSLPVGSLPQFLLFSHPPRCHPNASSYQQNRVEEGEKKKRSSGGSPRAGAAGAPRQVPGGAQREPAVVRSRERGDENKNGQAHRQQVAQSRGDAASVG